MVITQTICGVCLNDDQCFSEVCFSNDWRESMHTYLYSVHCIFSMLAVLVSTLFCTDLLSSLHTYVVGVRLQSGLLNLTIPNYGMIAEYTFRQDDYGVVYGTMNDVGENDSENDGLWCQSSTADTNVGTWIQPDGNNVPGVVGRNYFYPIYVVQAPSQVGLLRPNSITGVSSLLGLFQCMILDESETHKHW